ncbi:MAG TPA: ectonucleotide pyrophosphatase/phosphodiesterase [Kiritimatiellia bacterium]|nr:ectonucleotide pyrophosphatase/phosphodiesterase [Kiritimatiellia bacterium]
MNLKSIALALGVTVSAGLVRAEEAAPAPRRAAQHVVVISIDGLRPSFYLDAKFSKAVPTLVALRRAGSHAKRVDPPYPSLTYVGHASISTGARPARHGVAFGNNLDPIRDPDRGAWFAEDLKSPALWDRAAEAGLTTATLSWPSTAGATNITWNFPEFWPSRYGAEITLVRRHATPELLDIADSVQRRWPEALSKAEDRDAFIARLAEELIRRGQPDLMMVHFVEPDKAQHRYGPGSSSTRAAMTRADNLVLRLREAVRKAGNESNTAWIIVGDHGFADVEFSIAPNVLLAEHGYLTVDKGTIRDWTAITANSGGSAGVYLKDPKDRKTARAVRKLLEQHAESETGEVYFRIVERAQLDALGAAPTAAFYLEGDPSYMFSGSLAGGFLRKSSLRGQHGYLPDRLAMKTGFIAAGAGIRSRSMIEDMALIDVAPTVAALLGLDMPSAEGRVLTEVLK